jgi:hypothetical protein
MSHLPFLTPNHLLASRSSDQSLSKWPRIPAVDVSLGRYVSVHQPLNDCLAMRLLGTGKAGFIGSRHVRRFMVGQGHSVLNTIAEHVLSVVGKPEAFFDMSRVVHATTGAMP